MSNGSSPPPPPPGVPPPWPPPPLPLTVFDSPADPVLLSILHMASVSILSVCLARRLKWMAPSPRTFFSGLSWARLCVLLVLLDSWGFVFVSGILVHGIGLSTSDAACETASYACISFYSISKAFLYGFMVERVHIVWHASTPRHQSNAYRASALVGLGWAALVITMFVGKRVTRDPFTGRCSIGLPTQATIALAAYDIFLQAFMACLFALPLRHRSAKRLRSAALRALIAALSALTVSAVNLIVLASLHGLEEGFVCLASCILDMVLNALILVWVTTRRGDEDPLSVPSLDIRALEDAPEPERKPIDLERTTFASIIARPARTSVIYPPSSGKPSMLPLTAISISRISSRLSLSASERTPD